ncbi:MAG: hypothetical protein AB7I36_09310 [Rhodospirillaceae bacterium]
MYAIYFNDRAGGRAFIAAVDDQHSALSMAKLLSRQDPRDVVVVENRVIGDTVMIATFRRGARQAREDDRDLTAARRPAKTDEPGEHA